MDIEQIQKLINNKIEAGNTVKEVRKVIKTYKTQKQDMYDDTAEILKPSIEVQKEVKKTIDEKQDKIIEQLQENQLGINSELKKLRYATEDFVALTGEMPYYDQSFFQERSIEAIEQKDEPIDISKPGTAPKPKIAPKPKSFDINNHFTKTDRIILNNYKLAKPNDLLQIPMQKLVEEKIKSAGIAKTIGAKKSKKISQEDKKSYDIELQTLKKYRETITDLLTSFKYVQKTGKGIYTQKKRNAYKISQNGQYGGLVIDLPKLQGQLKVIAHKNGQKVYDKQADFDTLDLLTKRFNNKKNYSELARSVFSDLNRLSKIPIHRTSKKYSKLGSGVVYYNNPKDLLSRLELLGGSMSAGNNSSDVREEFVKIVHRLNKLNVIDNKQVNDLIKEYLI